MRHFSESPGYRLSIAVYFVLTRLMGIEILGLKKGAKMGEYEGGIRPLDCAAND
jgi:hypothetical protein